MHMCMCLGVCVRVCDGATPPSLQYPVSFLAERCYVGKALSSGRVVVHNFA